jgi:hypothetical protein
MPPKHQPPKKKHAKNIKEYQEIPGIVFFLGFSWPGRMDEQMDK